MSVIPRSPFMGKGRMQPLIRASMWFLLYSWLYSLNRMSIKALFFLTSVGTPSRLAFPFFSLDRARLGSFWLELPSLYHNDSEFYGWCKRFGKCPLHLSKWPYWYAVLTLAWCNFFLPFISLTVCQVIEDCLFSELSLIWSDFSCMFWLNSASCTSNLDWL